MSETPPLLPCPFCGLPGLYSSNGFMKRPWFAYHEATAPCPATMTPCYATRAEAAAVWNQRDTTLGLIHEWVAATDACMKAAKHQPEGAIDGFWDAMGRLNDVEAAMRALVAPASNEVQA